MPVAAVILGAYLLMVVYQGNSLALIQTVRKNAGFLPWLLALWILLFLSRTKTFGAAVSPLLAIAGVAFALNSLPQLRAQLTQAWRTIGE